MEKNQWIQLFESINLDEATMCLWHKEFEKQFPNDHQKFLEWLNIPPEEIKTIRKESKQG